MGLNGESGSGGADQTVQADQVEHMRIKQIWWNKCGSSGADQTVQADQAEHMRIK
ncbi:unnamed protein product [Arabidopsis lyrata]|uniref:Predicted protein n=1 Tax=Arabidopsis lyrata subsp. lyrata TaxID=81972 RepID=D7MP55_ARALL|nr:predicted protein [Arabidopsis lyrata subsp. lyrata]CAH8278498.1 unnamed protein product [Arabidopsis lyrata]